MNITIKKIKLERAARKAGCCIDYRKRILRCKTDEELIALYKKGIRFCMKEDYPSVDFITAHLDEKKLGEQGIYISKNLTGKEEHREIVALGCCNGSLRYKGGSASRIIAKNKTNLRVEVADIAFLMLDILDDAWVHVVAKDHSRVVVNDYGGNLTTDQAGEAIIKINNKKQISHERNTECK